MRGIVSFYFEIQHDIFDFLLLPKNHIDGLEYLGLYKVAAFHKTSAYSMGTLFVIFCPLRRQVEQNFFSYFHIPTRHKL